MLLAQAQPIDQGLIALRIRAAEVREQSPPLTDHFQQAAARMLIMLVHLQMLRQLINALGEREQSALRVSLYR